MASVLIVDDDAELRAGLAEAVADLGHEVHCVGSGAAALQILDARRIDVALLDLRMPGMDGLQLLSRIRTLPRAPIVSILTAHATAANTIEAMRMGAFDHLTKPIGRADIARILQRMLAVAGQAARDVGMASDKLVGASEQMRAVQKTIGLLADSDATVLVMGETGTGKELVARAIHEFGKRQSGRFVAVNCAAIPSELMESELFGHARGAFTGAVAERVGAFREAHGGTLLLDEIGDMDLAMQAKILRTLQERVVTPIGAKPVAIDVRVIAATHRDLQERVRDGLFREDLFYRLNVVPIRLPALRERIADIVPLAEHFLSRADGRKSLTADAAAALIRHPWRGNVRELRNAMERAAVLVRGGQVSSADLGFLQETGSSWSEAVAWPDEDLPSAVARLEEMLIRRALGRSDGNRSEAAKLLNINRQSLYAKLKRYGLDAGGDIELTQPG